MITRVSLLLFGGLITAAQAQGDQGPSAELTVLSSQTMLAAQAAYFCQVRDELWLAKVGVMLGGVLRAKSSDLKAELHYNDAELASWGVGLFRGEYFMAQSNMSALGGKTVCQGIAEKPGWNGFLKAIEDRMR